MKLIHTKLDCCSVAECIPVIDLHFLFTLFNFYDSLSLNLNKINNYYINTHSQLSPYSRFCND